jgi:hypothetical protein
MISTHKDQTVNEWIVWIFSGGHIEPKMRNEHEREITHPGKAY